MNCIDKRCKYVRCRELKLNSDILPDIIDCYCEIGKRCITHFNDNNQDLICPFYERRNI